MCSLVSEKNRMVCFSTILYYIDVYKFILGISLNLYHFFSNFWGTNSLLTCLRESFFGGLSAQLNGDKFIVVPSVAYGFRIWFSAKCSLDGKDGVSFQKFTGPEGSRLRRLEKNLRRGKHESVVHEELESLNIRFRGFTHLRSGHCDQDPIKDHPPTSNFIVSVARGHGV